MVELTIVRHGETKENVAGILQGRLPGVLTEKGRQQIAALRDNLEHKQHDFDVLLVSPLRRAVQTACVLNEVLHLPIKEEPLLQERDWGELTGHTVAEVRLIKEMPESVETVEAMFRRARTFLDMILAEYNGHRVLAVTHGLFARCIQAAFYGTTIREIPPMQNTEMRMMKINRVTDGREHGLPTADVVSDK